MIKEIMVASVAGGDMADELDVDAMLEAPYKKEVKHS